MELMMELTIFNVTDLQTLDAILDGPVAYPSRRTPSIPFSLKDSFLPYITTLNVTLRLPLAFFKAFDETKDFGERIPTPILEEHLNIWSTLPPRLAKLKTLHTLCIWLDHTHDRYWSAVNERTFLSHFESLASNSNIDFLFELPKLHPLAENPQRHYMEDRKSTNITSTSLSSLRIRRLLRQKYQSELNGKGHYQGFYVRDFPHSFGHPIVANISLADMEMWEGGMWRDGQHVQQILDTVMLD